MSSRALCLTTLVGLAAGAAVVTATSAGAAPITTTSTFQVTCHAVPSAFAGPQSDGKSVTVRVTAPPTVAPGETFDVEIDPGTVQVPNSTSGANLKEISRAKIDFAIPANAQFVTATVADPGNLTAGTPASMIRVDESGTPTSTGQILRLSGNNVTIGNGPSSSTNSTGGMTLNPDSGDTTTIRFPKTRITLTAGNAGTIEPRLRTSGAAGTFGSPESFLTLLPRFGHWLAGNIWAPTSCSPRDGEGAGLNDGAGPLASIAISGVDPGTQVSAAIEGPATGATGAKLPFTVKVTPDTATGTVQFKVDGKPVGEPQPVNAGLARLDLSFDQAGTKSVTAVLTTEDGNQHTTAAHTVTITAKGGPNPQNPGGIGSLDTGSLGS
ncbi:Ig-like domain-containing protein [Rhodococcus maanshanensis]|uniref:Ig-like domain (Group 3) n=1 Tax=Rhodococcus maanshanensis TaxID=183556 RepID=A0A1H7PNJ6_9NOCA|nr:Ig-like domain-containing protein [Rhodococcus maanshanensis]SEL37179.1 Ig-like domain (group 3) [Rhodococcus maanshanensis]